MFDLCRDDVVFAPQNDAKVRELFLFSRKSRLFVCFFSSPNALNLSSPKNPTRARNKHRARRREKQSAVDSMMTTRTSRTTGLVGAVGGAQRSGDLCEKSAALLLMSVRGCEINWLLQPPFVCHSQPVCCSFPHFFFHSWIHRPVL